MILFRYLSGEVLRTLFSVTGIVLVITMGWRFSGYLKDAASGMISRDILFLIIAYRLPGFLELIIPVAFFLAIMLAYGRMHVDSEMVVLESCGTSQHRLINITLSIAGFVMLLTAVLSLWLKPAGEHQIHLLLTGQQSLTEFDTLAPGRFQSIASGRRVTYVESFSDNKELENVFMNEYREARRFAPKDVVTLVAATGEARVDDAGNRFLVLEDGYRYSSQAGEKRFQVIAYEEYGQLLPRERERELAVRRSGQPTLVVLGSEHPGDIAEFQWRISIILMIPIVALMAIPLAKVNPRQGRFTRLVPGMILCFLYVVLLSSGRSAVEKETLPPFPGIYVVHLLFLAIAAALYRLDDLSELLSRLVRTRGSAT